MNKLLTLILFTFIKSQFYPGNFLEIYNEQIKSFNLSFKYPIYTYYFRSFFKNISTINIDSLLAVIEYPAQFNFSYIEYLPSKFSSYTEYVEKSFNNIYSKYATDNIGIGFLPFKTVIEKISLLKKCRDYETSLWNITIQISVFFELYPDYLKEFVKYDNIDDCVNYLLNKIAPEKLSNYSEIKNRAYDIHKNFEINIDYEWIEGQYGKSMKNIIYDEKSGLEMDFYFPNNFSNKKENGMFLFIHGGSFITGDKDSEIRYVSMMVSKGYACASINYTLLDNTNNTSFERILDDIHNSIDKIKELSDENNWNIKYLATSGYSAGGLLSLLFSYTRINDSSIPIKFAVAYVPVVEFSKESFSRSLFNDSIVSILSMGLNMNITHENFDNDPEIIKEVQKYSPLYQINKNCVPSLILNGLNDIFADKNGGRKMVKKLKENNVEYDYIELPNSGHKYIIEYQDNELIVDFDNLMEEYAIKYFKD